MKTITDSKDNIVKLAADLICGLVESKPDAVLALSVGNTQAPIYNELTRRSVSFKDVRIFSVCEYSGLAEGDTHSCGNILKELAEMLGTDKVFVPTEENAEEFEQLIEDCGGIDLAVLGIGLNGHIGFNEPGSFYVSRTRKVQLSDSTKRMKAPTFGGVENVPDHAVTMGIKTICDAKNVILTAFGGEKADIIYKLVYGKTESYVPAAMLQMHMNMTLLLDNEAAAKLG